MNNYFEFDREYIENAIYVEKDKSTEYIIENYKEGKKLQIDSSDLQLYINDMNLKKTDLLYGIHTYPIVSERFKLVLESHGIKDIEFHPVTVICNKSKKKDYTYYLLNVLDVVPCFDWEKSIYETFPDVKTVLMTVKKTVINEKKINGKDIVRLAEIPSIILVSKKIHDIIENNGIEGILLSDTSQITLRPLHSKPSKKCG